MQEERYALPLLPAGQGEQGTRWALEPPRLPAAELEAAVVVEQLRGTLRAPEWVAEVVARDPPLAKAHITVAMFRLGQIVDQLSLVEQPRIAGVLVERVIVSPRDIEVRLRQIGIKDLAFELRLTVPEEVAGWS